jgi:hypothetical protein
MGLLWGYFEIQSAPFKLFISYEFPEYRRRCFLGAGGISAENSIPAPVDEIFEVPAFPCRKSGGLATPRTVELTVTNCHRRNDLACGPHGADARVYQFHLTTEQNCREFVILRKNGAL